MGQQTIQQETTVQPEQQHYLHPYPPLHELLSKRPKSQLIKVLHNMWNEIPNKADFVKPQSKDRIRFVHVSDTHRIHDNILLPEGDVLIHTGDLVGNYGPSEDDDLIQHFKDCIQWFKQLLDQKKYEQVIFIAGNHDTILDSKKYDAEEAKKIVKNLPKNIVYLENESYNYKGVKIFGSPYVCCRVERFGQRFYSDGFERTGKVRQMQWQLIPENIDLLMTHVPPMGVLGGEKSSCEFLMQRFQKMKNPPKYHCFGHDHINYGIHYDKKLNMRFLNAAQLVIHLQEEMDPVALTFDIVPSNNEQ